ncbi:hypothetical protein_gp075 [Bacillus phage vB_BceM_WH1]|nr:hypothetical protein_gp075 [Bacillus phage vB_BceM_WH1]
MQLIYLTREKDKVEYIDKNLTIVEIVDNEVKTNQAVFSFTEGRYLILADDYEIEIDALITDEIMAADLSKNFIVNKLTIEEELEAIKKERDKLEQKNNELQSRINNTEDTVIQMMNMIPMLQKMNLPI